MSLCKKIVYLLLILVITFTFYSDVLSKQNDINIEVYNEIYSDDYTVLRVDYEFIDSIEIENIINEFDIAIASDGITYTHNINEIGGLYGTFRKCTVPFNANDNDCGYFLIKEDSMYYGYDKLENFDMNGIDAEKNIYMLIYINKSQAQQFEDYIYEAWVNEYGEYIPISFQSFSSMGFTGYSHNVDISIVVFMLILVIIAITVVESVKDLRKSIIIKIHAHPNYNVYFKFLLKNTFFDLLFLFAIYIMAIISIHLIYQNNFFTIDYIKTTWSSIMVLVAISLFITTITYIIINAEKVENYLKERYIVLRSFLSLVITFVVMLVVVSINLPMKALASSARSYYSVEMSQRQEEYFGYMYFLEEDDDSEIEEIKKILNDNMFLYREAFSAITYMSSDYASLLFDYDFGKGNYFLNDACDNFNVDRLPINTPNTMLYRFSHYNYKMENFLIEETMVLEDGTEYTIPESRDCYIVIEDREQFLNTLDIKFGYESIEIVGKSEPITNLKRDTKYKPTYDFLLVSLEFPLVLSLYIMITLLLMIISSLLMYVYLILFHKYEYLRYIYDRNYRFMFRYFIPKMIFNICAIILLLPTLQFGFAICFTITDIIIYLLFRRKFLKRMIELGEVK